MARNAVVPVLTVAGLQLGFLLGGTVVTETLFNRPGLGKLLVGAISGDDLPWCRSAYSSAGGYVLANLAVDLDLRGGAGSTAGGWQWGELRQQCASSRCAMVAAGGHLPVLLAALLAPWLPPDAIDLAAQLAPPSSVHPLGAQFLRPRPPWAASSAAGPRFVATLAAVALAAPSATNLMIGCAGYAQGWASQAWIGLMDDAAGLPRAAAALLVKVRADGPAGRPALAVAVGISSIPATHASCAASC